MEELYDQWKGTFDSGICNREELDIILRKIINSFQEKYGKENYRVKHLRNLLYKDDRSQSETDQITFILHAEVLGIDENQNSSHGHFLHSLKLLYKE